LHQKDEKPTAPANLGPPPSDRAVNSRMSPAGISLFYGAMNQRTARAETFGPVPGSFPEHGTIASWTSTRPLLVLDLTKRLDAPSFYNADASFSYDEVGFLYDFIADITQPIERDGREHIEYVPSQIVTEYFRTSFRALGGQRLDGIIYPSARTKRGKCIVIFVGYDEMNPTYGMGDPVPLVLNPASPRRTSTRPARTSARAAAGSSRREP
jgi:hypothetical protein